MLLGRIKALDIGVVAVLVGGHGFLEVVPPTSWVEHPPLGNEAEPRRKEQIGVGHHVQESLLGDPFNGVNLVGMGLDRELGLVGNAEKQDVINLVLSPGTKNE